MMKECSEYPLLIKTAHISTMNILLIAIYDEGM